MTSHYVKTTDLAPNHLVGTKMPVVIDTKRLILRLPSIDDVPLWSAYFRSERGHWLGEGPDTKLSQAQMNRAFAHAAGLWLLRGYGSYVLHDKAAGVAIGMVGIWHPIEWPEPEFAWTIWEGAFEHRGYAREAMQAVAPFAFDALKRDSFVSYIWDENEASQNLAKRLGARIDSDAAQPEAEGLHHVWRHYKEEFRYD